MEGIYAWDKVEGAGRFTRVTLTERDTADRSWRRRLRHEMCRALDEIKPAAIVINGWANADAFSALAWGIKNNIPAVVMSESTAWDEPRVFWKEWLKGRLVRMCAAGLAGGTPHADYLAQLGLPRDRIFLGYDIVDNEHFAAKADEARKQPAEIRKQFGLPEKYFLASARFVEKKNLFRLIEAYGRYRQQAPGSELWDLVLLGDGALKPGLRKLIASLGLESCVHLPGFKQYEELPAYFGLARVFIHPSTTEQWGLVVNEAMASGLPVLVSNRCGCAADLVSPGVNGFQFNPQDVEELASLMARVSDSKFPLSEYGAASVRIVSAWGPERFANGLREAVAVAVKQPRPPAGWLDRLLLWLLLQR